MILKPEKLEKINNLATDVKATEALNFIIGYMDGVKNPKSVKVAELIKLAEKQIDWQLSDEQLDWIIRTLYDIHSEGRMFQFWWHTIKSI